MSRVSVMIRQDGAWTPAPARGIKLSHQVPGGMLSASFTLDDSPIKRLLRTDAQVHITSTSTAQVLWSGRVADPSQVSADGDAALLATSHARRPYVVTELSAWERDDQHSSAQAATMSVTNVDVEPTWSGLVLQIPEGTTITASGGTRIRARTYAYDGTGYEVGVLHLRHCETVISDKWRTFAIIGLDFGTNRLFESPFSNVPGEAIYARGVTPNFSAPSTLATICMETTSTLDYAKADDRRWSGWPILSTVAQLRDRFGADVNPMPQRSALFPHEVVNDLLGRDLLGKVSPAAVDTLVNTGSLDLVDSLSYTDPVTPAHVLDDLVAHTLGDFYYAIWPGTDSTGRPGLWWMPWPSSPRYVLPPGVTDVTVTGSDEGLCNRVRVRWMDQFGRVRETVETSSPMVYPDLADLGYWDESNGWARIVEAPPIDMTSTRYSTQMAGQVARTYARQVATRPRAGTATIRAREAMDLYTGQPVPPEEMRPGYLAWSPELGQALRVTATEYDDDTESCTLHLDSPRSTVDQLIARALRASRRRGRR